MKKLSFFVFVLLGVLFTVSCSRESSLSAEELSLLPHNINKIRNEEIFPQAGENISSESIWEEMRYAFGMDQLMEQEVIFENGKLYITTTLQEDPLLSQIHAARSFVLKKFVVKSTGMIGVEPYDEWLLENGEDIKEVYSLITANGKPIIYEEYDGVSIRKIYTYPSYAISAQFYEAPSAKSLTHWIVVEKISAEKEVRIIKDIQGAALVVVIHEKDITKEKIHALENYLAEEFAKEVEKHRDIFDAKWIVLRLEKEKLYYESAYRTDQKEWVHEDWMNSR